MFESAAEVDIKFSKLIDKECENITTDVRKWFKKLAKEERAHDERIMTANDKIKQAGAKYSLGFSFEADIQAHQVKHTRSKQRRKPRPLYRNTIGT